MKRCATLETTASTMPKNPQHGLRCTLLPLLVAAAFSNSAEAAVSFVDDFDAYANGAPDAAFNANYNYTLAPVVAGTTGLGGTKSLENAGDMTLTRKNLSIDLTTFGESIVTINLFFQWSGASGLASPQVGLVGTDTGVFNAGTAGDLSGRINNAGTLELRSNNTELTRGGVLTLTTNNWYNLRAIVTRSSTTNLYDLSLGLYNSSSAGVVGSAVDTLSISGLTNSTLYGDTSLYPAARENSPVPRIDNFSVTQVPESGSAMFACLGLAGLMQRRRRSR